MLRSKLSVQSSSKSCSTKRDRCSLFHSQIYPLQESASAEYVVMLEPSDQTGEFH